MPASILQRTYQGSCCKELLDRGYGKASQAIEHSGEIGSPNKMSDLELARRTAFMLQKAKIALDQDGKLHPPNSRGGWITESSYYGLPHTYIFF